MTMEELSLIDKLKVYQALNRLKQVEVGERLNVSQPFISKVLKKQVKPSFELEQRIIELLKQNNLY